PGRSRANRHASGAEMAEAVMVQRAAIAQRNADHRLLRRGGCLADSFRHLARLAVAETGATLAVANDHEGGKAEALAPLHSLRDAIDVDELLDQLLAALLVIAAPATIVTTAASATAALAAPAATTAAR